MKARPWCQTSEPLDKHLSGHNRKRAPFFLEAIVFYLSKINFRQRIAKCLLCETPQQFAANVRVNEATTTCERP
jgi:hypothetical protein